MSITVVVVDDESLVASSLSTLLDLEDDLRVVATLGSGEDLLSWWDAAAADDAAHRADVVVMDLQLGGIDGVETARRLAQQAGETPAVLIVTSHGRPRELRQALAAGIPGFVRKTSTAAEFATAVRAVHAGRRYIDPDLAAAGRGGSVEQIAATVHLAPGTTRNYLSSAMGKTGAATRFEAWRIARERDWL